MWHCANDDHCLNDDGDSANDDHCASNNADHDLMIMIIVLIFYNTHCAIFNDENSKYQHDDLNLWLQAHQAARILKLSVRKLI